MTMDVRGPLLLVGCGKMGGAMLAGWLDKGLDPKQVTIVEPSEEARAAFRQKDVNAVASEDELAEDFAPRVVLLAVKPQVMGDVLPPYRRFAGPDTVFISIAAGKTIAFFERHLGGDAAIVRTIPNTPAAVGRGITGMAANAQVDETQKMATADLLSAIGETVWLDDESLIDVVTAVSGSGPAYVFYLIECLAAAGASAGLPPEQAMRFARAVVCGAGELAYRDSAPAEQLRRNVTSPGGTTQAALDVLMATDGLEPLMTRAVRAAAERSRELAD
jgi:pyrroline-5-carboxylate reductase